MIPGSGGTASTGGGRCHDVAAPVTRADHGRAIRLLGDVDLAKRHARSIADEGERASALAGIAKVLAASNPDLAERLARSIADERRKATALIGVAKALAASDPDRAAGLIADAERAARSIASYRGKRGHRRSSWSRRRWPPRTRTGPPG